MTLIEEVAEILRNARSAWARGEITTEQYWDAVRIPLMDLMLGKEWK